jgi:hypothetical protein
MQGNAKFLKQSQNISEIVGTLHFGGLLSFAFGGTILLLVLINIVENVGYDYSSIIPETVIAGFVSFMLIGYGLFANIKSLIQKNQTPIN